MSMSSFSYFDIILFVLILLFGFKGVINGFIREFFGLVGIVGGVYIASLYSDSFGGWISDNIYRFDNQSAISLVGFFVALVGFWILSVLLSGIFQKLVALSYLGIANRIFGFCFGALKIFMIFAIIFYALSGFQLAQSFIDKYTNNSHLYPVLVKTGVDIVKLDSVQGIADTASKAIENNPTF